MVEIACPTTCARGCQNSTERWWLKEADRGRRWKLVRCLDLHAQHGEIPDCGRSLVIGGTWSENQGKGGKNWKLQ
eukprot:755247-Hanusia_phi.AAC.1